MVVHVLVPDMTEGDEEPIVVGYWFARPGQTVLAGDELVEVLCGKTVFTVCSPVTGTVADILAEDEDVVQRGTPLAMIQTQEPGS